MNAFYQHHKDSISFHYSCFDRILLNGLIQPFQQPERVVGFFSSYRDVYPVSRQVLRDIANQYQNWVVNRSKKWGAPILEPPEEQRRDDFVTPYFDRSKPDQVVAIVKAREPARILIAIGNNQSKGYHLEFKRRWIQQYNFYINDRRWGRMFVRICPYFPFSARICLNQHNWLAIGMRDLNIRFKQCSNAFTRCSDPALLQELADSLDPKDIISCAQKWVAALTLSSKSRSANTAVSTTYSFLRSKSHYKNGFIKQYVRDVKILRTESASNNVTDYGVGKAVENLPQLRQKLQTITQTYLDVQQDILEAFVDRGELSQLSSPTITASGKRIPGLKLDNPRQLAVMHALVRFCNIAAQSTFTTAQLYPHVMEALGPDADKAYSLGSLRYDLSKLKAKGLIEKIPKSRRYRFLPNGYRLSVVYLKLFEKLYAPLVAGIVHPARTDKNFPNHRMTLLDRLYSKLANTLDGLIEAVGLKFAA